MTRVHGLRRLAVGAALLAMAACTTNGDETREGAPLARQVTAASQCGFDEPGLVHVDTPAGLARLVRAGNVNLTSVEGHDFSREHLLVVAAGQKPTGGYGVALQDAHIQDKVLRVAAELRGPGAGQMVTQALTSPCAVLAITPSGWRRIAVSGPGLPDFPELVRDR